MKKQDSAQIYHSSESECPITPSQPARRHKKIKKQHRKKKSRVVPTSAKQDKPLVEQFMADNQWVLGQEKQVVLDRLRAAILGSCHVRQLLSRGEDGVFGVKQADCQQETWRYLAFLKAIQHSTYQKIAIRGSEGAFSLPLLRPTHPHGHTKGLGLWEGRFLSSSEEWLLRRRALVRDQVRDYVLRTAVGLGYSQIQLGDPELELLALAKINNQLEAEIFERISLSLNRENAIGNYRLGADDSAHFLYLYKKQLLIKNLEKACTEEPIDFLNYHKRIESYESNGFMEGEFGMIENMAGFKKYMEWRKPRLNKCSKNHLKTPCSACFSDFSEMSNPILKCPECPIRIHKNCQKVENRCHRCRFSRTSNQEKTKTGYCYICQRPREKGLMILTVTNTSPHYFAHNFCLLVHALWQLEDGDFRGQYVAIPPNPNPNPCRFCQNTSGLMLECGCGERMHAMCAYLEGVSFRVEKGDSYTVRVDCCRGENIRHRLSLERKFKLNYEKVIFRENKQLFDYIQANIAE